MPLSSTVKNHLLTIQLPETFTFQVQSEFRKEYESKLNRDVRQLVVDFRQTRYMDSASLGMLLVLQEYVGKNSNVLEDRIELINCSKMSEK